MKTWCFDTAEEVVEAYVERFREAAGERWQDDWEALLRDGLMERLAYVEAHWTRDGEPLRLRCLVQFEPGTRHG